jgi:hypothetical protein
MSNPFNFLLVEKKRPRGKREDNTINCGNYVGPAARLVLVMETLTFHGL